MKTRRAFTGIRPTLRRLTAATILITAAAGMSSASAAAAAVSGTGTGLTAEYFGNQSFGGQPLATQLDPTVNFDWSWGAPAGNNMPSDNFSVRWSGLIEAPLEGKYQILTSADDGVRVSIDGALVVNDWNDHGATTTKSKAIQWTAGSKHSITVEYYENTGAATIKLSWKRPDGKTEIIPANYLYPSTTTSGGGDTGGGDTGGTGGGTSSGGSGGDTGSVPSQPLAAPQNLSGSASLQDGMPMVSLSWSAVSGAASYNVYRDGQQVQTGVTETAFMDMSVTTSKTYSYEVAAVDANGAEGTHSAAVSVTTPAPAASTGDVAQMTLPAPTNVQVVGSWLTDIGAPTDTLTWDAVPGAVSYNVYLYDQQIGSGIKNRTWLVPSSLYHDGLTYTVTTVDANGNESLPSAPQTAQGSYNPLQYPGWSASAPEAPQNLVTTGEWNLGAPRIRVTWTGYMSGDTYSVFRDGVKVAEGIWSLYYIDNDVKPGESHTYTVTGVNHNWMVRQESPQSPAVTGTAPSAAPAGGGKVQVEKIVSNDDSVRIYFAPVPGAVDYRVYDPKMPGDRKYSGGNLSIEWNGVDPSAGADLVVEALDKFGPFQRMDGSLGPGAWITSTGSGMGDMSGMSGSTSGKIMRMETNGQGDPSNVPNVLATSDVFHVSATPLQLTGQQAFLDTFRDEQTFQKVLPIDSRVATYQYNTDPNDPDNLHFQFYQNDKWTIGLYDTDMTNTKFFFMSDHFMDTEYDGGTPYKNPPIHNNNASLVMTPRATADISGGKVLHVTLEVDPHMNGRRWTEVWISPAGEPILNPGKFVDNVQLPNPSGNLFRWQSEGDVNTAELFVADGKGFYTQYDGFNGDLTNVYGSASRKYNGQNGTTQDLDRRHKFDLYISEDRFRIVEEGQVIKDGPMPGGQKLPFTNIQVHFIHQVYHTANDRPEQVNYYPAESYWYNFRPWADERHWDNMGFEVLDSFPQ